MAASQKTDVQCQRVYELALSTSKMLNIVFDKSKIVVDDRFIGPGYALPSKEADKAAKMFACLEGVLLDDVYTGKAGAGLIHYAVNAMFGKEDNILFLHTGGNAGLFY